MPMMLSIQITKLKFRQYKLRAISPNLIFAKVTRYMVIMSLTCCKLQIFYFKIPDDIDIISIEVTSKSGKCAIVSVQNISVSGYH